MKALNNFNLSLVVLTISMAVLSGISIYLDLAKSYRIEIRYCLWLFIFFVLLSGVWLVVSYLKEAPKGGDEFYKTKDNLVSKAAYIFTISASAIGLVIISSRVGSVRHGAEFLGLPPIFWIGFEAAIFTILSISNFGILLGRLIIWFKYR